jgi:hypothetical protein
MGSSPAPPQKKRKISATTHGEGRVLKGKDFWSLADAFFAQKVLEFGSKNLQSAGWKEYVLIYFLMPQLTKFQRYITDTISMDEYLFPDREEREEGMQDVAPSASSGFGANNLGGTGGSSSLLKHI